VLSYFPKALPVEIKSEHKLGKYRPMVRQRHCIITIVHFLLQLTSLAVERKQDAVCP
jgi:hypothetical protein